MEGLNYPVIGMVKSKSTGELYPILDIPLMSDEDWNRLASSPEQLELRNMPPHIREACRLLD